MLWTGLRSDLFISIPGGMRCGSALLHHALALFQIVTSVDRAAAVVCILSIRPDIWVIIAIWGWRRSGARWSAGTWLLLRWHALCSG